MSVPRLIALAAFVLAAPAAAVSGGKIGTLERGIYVCELPGDASTQRGIPQPELGFEIANSSTYKTTKGNGNYLRTADRVVMTSGPRKGDRYVAKSERYLRKLEEDGSESPLRCIKLGSTSD